MDKRKDGAVGAQIYAGQRAQLAVLLLAARHAPNTARRHSLVSVAILNAVLCGVVLSAFRCLACLPRATVVRTDPSTGLSTAFVVITGVAARLARLVVYFQLTLCHDPQTFTGRGDLS